MYFVQQIPLYNPAQPRPITTLLFTDLHVETLLNYVLLLYMPKLWTILKIYSLKNLK